MRTIFQTDRVLLQAQLKAASSYVTGRTLDVGSGAFLRYRDLFSCTSYETLEPDAGKRPTIVGSAEKIPIPDASFDTIILTQVLEHISHPQKAVAEMFRVLKPGGYAVISVPQWNELHEEPSDYFRFTKYGLAVLFQEAGFEIARMEARGGFFAFLGQAIARCCIDFFHLYESRFWNAIWFMPLKLTGTVLLWLDRRFHGAAFCKHAIGWLCIARKPLV